MSAPLPIRRKLIEVALPLEAINTASAREKSIRHGHPSTLHLWWARRPLAAARAVIFAQMVDDPSCYVDVLRSDGTLRRRAERLLKERKEAWEEASEYFRQMAENAKAPGPEPKLDEILAELERARLFKIIEELIRWENTTNENVLKLARNEIWASWRRACTENAMHPNASELFDRKKIPAFHDAFAGGGAIPLEAQRLGLESHASDLNPVAVLINKAMIEIPPKFAGRPPVNPLARTGQLGTKTWHGAQGLAEDVRYYAMWMRERALKKIGEYYPSVVITPTMTKDRPDLRPLVGKQYTVIAWLWARTIKSPNPAFRHVDVPLASTFVLSSKEGREAWLEPIITGSDYRFKVRVGKPSNLNAAKNGTKLARGANFRCLLSDTPITGQYIKGEGMKGRLGARLLAIVVEGDNGRLYLPPEPSHERCATSVKAPVTLDQQISYDPHSGATFCVLYGLKTFGDLFTARQLLALNTFSQLVGEATEQAEEDAIAAGMESAAQSKAYATALKVYLAIVVDKCSDYWSSVCSWHSSGEKMRNTFGRQGIPMVWDFAEANPFCESSGNFMAMADWTWKALQTVPAAPQGHASQANAASQEISSRKVVSIDPPYFDNIGYADLSDFFYVWLRRVLQPSFPELFSTVTVPKLEELVVTPSRHGGIAKAEQLFLAGMTEAMRRIAGAAHPAFPVTIYYAFKQAESETDAGTASTGWEIFLDAVIRAGLSTTGTWPMRTELGTRMIGRDTNALASSIVLVCRPRPADAPTATRREFVAALQRELPEALRYLQAGNIAPVDLAQAAIGPGMGVFTRYRAVLKADAKSAEDRISVREALALINETLDAALAEQEGDFDADSRWALAWFEQNGFDGGEFGVAETLSKAKNTSITGLVDGGILESKRGRVRLLKPEELAANWDPALDSRVSHWETVHQLIRALAAGGEPAAAELVKKLGAKSETARELAYRLYTVCERKKRAAEALAYNGLVQSWPEILRQAQEAAPAAPAQGELL